jgi:hypothetical protein
MAELKSDIEQLDTAEPIQADEVILEGEDPKKKKDAANTVSAPISEGDKGKKPTDRIPLPDYKNPSSRLDYAKQFTSKYGALMSGRGDTPLRINEVPQTWQDKLTSKQIAQNASKPLGLDPALLYSSAMEEGMSGLYPDKNGEVSFSGDTDFPVSGYVNFGLDTFSDAFPALVKKGYLPKEFEKEFKKKVHPPLPGDNKVAVNSADFSTAEAAFKAKAAMTKSYKDEVEDFASKNKIQLSDKAKDFFTLVSFNAGSGNARKMLKEYNSLGALKGDAFLNKRPSKSWAAPYENVIRRIQMADALKAEGYFDPESPNPSPAPEPENAPAFDMFNPKEFIN